MTDDEFEAACDELMNLIEADGASATLTEHTISIDLYDWQVPLLVAQLRERHQDSDDEEHYCSICHDGGVPAPAWWLAMNRRP